MSQYIFREDIRQKRILPFRPQWRFDFKIFLLVIPDTSNLSFKFECCVVFRFRVNSGTVA